MADTDIYYSRSGFTLPGYSGGIIRSVHALGETWRLTEQIGRGKMEKLTIRPGLELWTVDCTFNESLRFRLNETRSVISFSFSLSGSTRIRLDRENQDLFIDQDRQGMFFFHSQTGSSRVEAGRRLTHINIQASPEWLFSYLEDGRLLIPEGLKQAVRSGDQSFFLIRAMTPAMAMAVHQVRHSPFCGRAERLYLESRILELISRQIALLALDNGQGDSSPLDSADKEGVARARAMLVADIHQTPGLAELSREAGMSHPKLTRCFKSIYGMTLFEYLREIRLNRARVLLEDHNKSVTEASYSVGYSSLSHFARAYRSRFGISPGSRNRN
ncbi:MAG: AraC family transcriptional regulator [Desulfobacterales bacterium]|nr:AraC family transcriptional regulator [Desulfobacterales bacterium]